MGYTKRQAKKDLFFESRKHQKSSQIMLSVASCVFSTIYLIWRAIFTVPLEYGWVALVLGLLLLMAETMAAIESMIQFRQINKRMIPEMPTIPETWYPDVDVFIATHNESVDLLYSTVSACNYMHYPDRSKVHIYLCDDNNRPEMAELAEKLGVGYFGLSGNKHAKAGNLNNAMRQTHSPLIATFDSDMIPTSDFLMKTVPYFFIPQLKKDHETGLWVSREENEIDPDFKIGFIQTPQSFYNPDLFQFNLFSETRIPNEQDFFFREVNVGRNADNGVIYAGSNTLLSRKALEEVGYIATTSITEDFMTGLRIQKKGYTTYAVPDELAHGLSPNTVSSLLKQRERWGRGCIQALRQERFITAPELSFWTKLSYIATWSYWWAFARRFIYIISPIVSILFLLPVMDVTTWQVFVFWLPHYVFSNAALKSASNGVRNRHWSNLYDTIMFPYLIVPILLEAIGIKKRKFVVTNKERAGQKRDLSMLFMLPHAELLIASVLAIITCVRMSIITNSFYNPIIFFWLCVNTTNIVFSVLFMYGRKNYRMADRHYVEVPVRLKTAGGIVSAKTSDLSETGLAILIDRPVYFPTDAPTSLHVEYKEYAAEMLVDIVHVVKVGDLWKYSVHINEIGDYNYSQYLQIIHDRSHSMPRHLDASLSIFDDFNINLTAKRSGAAKQTQQTRYSRREASLRVTARIRMDIPFTLEDGTQGIIADFNYHYAMLKFTSQSPELAKDEIIRLDIEPGATLYLEDVSEGNEDNGQRLYRVLNVEEFVSSPNITEVIDAWSGSGQKKAAGGFTVRERAAAAASAH